MDKSWMQWLHRSQKARLSAVQWITADALTVSPLTKIELIEISLL